MPSSTQLEPVNKIYKSRLAIFIDNTIGGIGWGIGSVVGAALTVATIGFIITQSKSIPFLSSIVSIIASQVQNIK
jgi:hypothetical protein